MTATADKAKNPYAERKSGHQARFFAAETEFFTGFPQKREFDTVYRVTYTPSYVWCSERRRKGDRDSVAFCPLQRPLPSGLFRAFDGKHLRRSLKTEERHKKNQTTIDLVFAFPLAAESSLPGQLQEKQKSFVR
jgi:hypothetical protein